MTLLIGYGNPGRGDDGLGPALAERIAGHNLPGVVIRSDYQLKPEHALWLAEARCVVFADARLSGPQAFDFAPLHPARDGDVTSHSLPPGALLTIARTLCAAAPPAFLMGITGGEFGRVHEGLSRVAQENLARAEAFLCDWLMRNAPGIPAGRDAPAQS